MRRSILFLTLGLFCTALLCSAVSVYIFHDVDRDKIGNLNEAFVGLCVESLLFALIIGGLVAIFTFLGRYLLDLRIYLTRAFLGLFLGIGVTVFQYPWELAARKALPKFADFSLLLYLVVAVIVCTVVLLRESSRQMRLYAISTTS